MCAVELAMTGGQMGGDQPAWYYVDGQLRYKDGAGWTDQYQSIDRASESKVLRTAEPEVFTPTTRAEARKQGTSRNRQKSRLTPDDPPEGLPASTHPGNLGRRNTSGRARVSILRGIGAVVLVIGGIGVWFGLAPADADTTSGYHQRITATLVAGAKSNKTAHGPAQHAAVDGRTAKDLLAILAQEGADLRSVDERPAALLALLVVGLGIGLATARPTGCEPAMSSPSSLQEIS